MTSLISGAQYWQRRLGKWRHDSRGPRSEGYTLLMPVPGDIPVFLELALKVCHLQHDASRVRTLVIPDRPSHTVEAIIERHRPDWGGPLDLTLLPHPERHLLPYLRSGSRNHGLQVVTGVEETASTHIVLHDADLFLLDRDLLDSQYRLCRDRDLDCLGVSPVWDSWYAAHDRQLAATWELVASVDWLRSFEPWHHMGHDAELWGETHTFDTTLWAQTQTPANRIDHVDRGDDFVHFNYVITSYRHWQRQGSSYVDSNFRILLISLFVELFSETGSATDVPSLEEIAGGLTGTGPLRYPPADEAQQAVYGDFRRRLHKALGGPFMRPGELEAAAAALAPFDEYHQFVGG
jgi:hypothetical protein